MPAPPGPVQQQRQAGQSSRFCHKVGWGLASQAGVGEPGGSSAPCVSQSQQPVEPSVPGPLRPGSLISTRAWPRAGAALLPARHLQATRSAPRPAQSPANGAGRVGPCGQLSRRSVPQGRGDGGPAAAGLRGGGEASPGMGTWVQPSGAGGWALASRDPDTQTCLCCPLVPMAATAGRLGSAPRSRGWSRGAGLGAHTRHGAGGGGGTGAGSADNQPFHPALGEEGTSRGHGPPAVTDHPRVGGAATGPLPWVPQPLGSGVADALGHLVKQGSCSDGR